MCCTPGRLEDGMVILLSVHCAWLEKSIDVYETNMNKA